MQLDTNIQYMRSLQSKSRLVTGSISAFLKKIRRPVFTPLMNTNGIKRFEVKCRLLAYMLKHIKVWNICCSDVKELHGDMTSCQMMLAGAVKTRLASK